MSTIQGIPYYEVHFEKNGKPLSAVPALPPGTTDLHVISHGWNNNNSDARKLYHSFFESFHEVTKDWPERQERKLAILGIFWPAKALDAAVEQAVASQGGAASVGPTDEEDAAEEIQRLLDAVEDLNPDNPDAINTARALVPQLENSGTARDSFVETLRGLLNREFEGVGDASKVFFSKSGDQILTDLAIPTPATAFSNNDQDGGAVGFRDRFQGFKAGTVRFLNYFTYYEMKSRAGAVGAKGVAPLLRALAPSTNRIHLIGHSFGGRLVSAVAKEDQSQKIASLTLLQAAFSHNGFSKTMGGFFRSVVNNQTIRGPIVITHTENDSAVGVAYPLASRLANETAAKLGDASDKYGGIGRNGAQQMESSEVSTKCVKLLPVGSKYLFSARQFHNLEASEFISNHGDVAGKEVGYAHAVASLLP